MDGQFVKPPRRNNSLTQARAARLYAWLDESRIWASENTAQVIAVKAAEELKFGITSSNILSAKKALGIVKPVPVAPAGECRCRDLAKVMLRWAEGCATEEDFQAYTSSLRAFVGNGHKPPVAPELPLTTGTSPLKFEAAS